MLTVHNTVCSRSLDSFHKVSDYINWVATSWTYSTLIRSLTVGVKASHSFSSNPAPITGVYIFRKVLPLICNSVTNHDQDKVIIE